MKLFRILQLVIAAGLILGIFGVTSGGSQAADGAFIPSTSSKVGIILYIVVLAALALIFIRSLPNASAVPHPERLLIAYIPIALLAIAVRLLYAALCIFVHNNTFSLFGSSIVADVVMAIVVEFFIVIITLVLGFKLGRINDSVQGEIVDHNPKDLNLGQQLPGSKDEIYAQPSNSGFERFSSG